MNSKGEFIMAIYEFQNEKFKELKEVDFNKENIRESDIQNAIKGDINIIASDCLIIAKEFSKWEGSSRRIDLLAVDTKANLVVVELKRAEGAHMELQSLRYAAMISTLTYEDAVKTYKSYLASINGDPDTAEENLHKHFEWGDGGPKPDEFALNVRIILVSEKFDPEITTTVMWLNQTGMKITCIQLISYKYEDKIFIDSQQIIPLREAEDYQIRVNVQKAERMRAQSNRDYTKFNFDGEYNLPKNRLVLAIITKYIEDNNPTNIDELREKFNHCPHRKDLFAKYDEIPDKQRYFRLEDFLDGQYAVYGEYFGDMIWIRSIAEDLGYPPVEIYTGQ